MCVHVLLFIIMFFESLITLLLNNNYGNMHHVCNAKSVFIRAENRRFFAENAFFVDKLLH